MAVGRRVRDGCTAAGNWLLLICAAVGIDVGNDCSMIDCVGCGAERGVASAAQDTNKTQNNECMKRFIGLSISMKN
jgi:hypothetical protein